MSKLEEIKANLAELNRYIELHGKFDISVDDYTSDVSALLLIVDELEAELDANANMISSLQWQVETEQRLGVERRAKIANLENELHDAIHETRDRYT